MKLMESQLLEGTISLPDRKRLQHHLDTCDHCFATWERLQQVDRQLKTAMVVEPSPSLAQRLEASMASLPPRHSQSFWSPDHTLCLLVAPFLMLCASLLMAISTLWQQPMLWVPSLLVQLPRLVVTGYHILNSELVQHVQHWSNAFQTFLYNQLQALAQMSTVHVILIGYLFFACLLGLTGFYLLNRMNLHAVWVNRTS